MAYAINHLHLKSADPERSAAWWSEAFKFEIVSDATRSFGDRFLVCRSENGINVMISNERAGEQLGVANSGAHFGLEHFGFDSDDLEKDIDRLVSLGATLAEPPIEAAPGVRICFLSTPDQVRIELIERRA